MHTHTHRRYCINSGMLRTFRPNATAHPRTEARRACRHHTTSRMGLKRLLLAVGPPNGRGRVRISCTECPKHPRSFNSNSLHTPRNGGEPNSALGHTHTQTHSPTHWHTLPARSRGHVRTCVANVHYIIVYNAHNTTQRHKTAPPGRTIMCAQIEINA